MEVGVGTQGELIPLLAPDQGSRECSIHSTSTNSKQRSNMYKFYLKCLALVVLFSGSFGMILPFLISAPSNFAVAGGLFYLLVVLPYIALKLVISIEKDLK